MNTKTLTMSGFLVLIVFCLNIQPALAHESITVGDYELEIGWVDEPPIVGQQNAILVIVSYTGSGEAPPVEDLSSLELTISYGGQSKELALQPLGDDTPGQFMAPVLPTVPGQYTIRLGGTLGDTAIDAELEPEEVASADLLHFPGVESPAQGDSSATGNWLTWLAILLGLVGIGLGISAHRKVR